MIIAIIETVQNIAQDVPESPQESPKYKTHKAIANSTDTPVMILDATSKKSYKECVEYISNNQDFSSSHISLVETAINNGYDVILSCFYNGTETYIHLEDWIETLEVNYNLDDYTYEEILITGFQNWYTGFEI